MPAPKIENFSIPGLLENGACIRVTCTYKKNLFHEVTYDFDILKVQSKMPQDPFLSLGLIPNYKPPPEPKGEAAFLVRDLRNEETIEYDINNIVKP